MSSAHAEEEHNPYLAEHFETEEQQNEACTLGMWLFLAQEFMFFGAMFCAYAVYRYMYTEAWVAGSMALSVPVGAINTTVLLLSSFSMAMGVYYSQVGDTKRLIRYLIVTLLLGLLFVVLKLSLEWYPKYTDGAIPGALWNPHGHYASLAEFTAAGGQGIQMFYWLYFVMTGMHALHMVIGFGIIIGLIVMAKKEQFGPRRHLPILFFGLYWHFVDIVWVFLFPMYYLVR